MKITLVFFTLLGIYNADGQNIALGPDSTTGKNKMIPNVQHIKPDSLLLNSTAAMFLYPNPAKNSVEIKISGFQTGDVMIQLYDNNGKIHRTEKRMVFNGNESIVLLFAVEPGLYYVSLKQGIIKLKRRLLVQ